MDRARHCRNRLLSAPMIAVPFLPQRWAAVGRVDEQLGLALERCERFELANVPTRFVDEGQLPVHNLWHAWHRCVRALRYLCLNSGLALDSLVRRGWRSRRRCWCKKRRQGFLWEVYYGSTVFMSLYRAGAARFTRGEREPQLQQQSVCDSFFDPMNSTSVVVKVSCLAPLSPVSIGLEFCIQCRS